MWQTTAATGAYHRDFRLPDQEQMARPVPSDQASSSLGEQIGRSNRTNRRMICLAVRVVHTQCRLTLMRGYRPQRSARPEVACNCRVRLSLLFDRSSLFSRINSLFWFRREFTRNLLF